MINPSPHLTRLPNGTTVALFIVLALSTMIAYCQTPGAESPSEAKAIRAQEHYDPSIYFDKIWETINDEFWDPNFNNVNWKDIGKRYRSRALAAANHESFALIINQMLGTLKTSHTRYLTKWEPDYYTLQAVFASSNLAYLSSLQASVLEQRLLDLLRSQGGPHRTGIGVITKNIDGRHYVTAVVSSSPGKEAGIVLGDWLVEVDDLPFHPIRSFSGKGGQEVKLVIQGGPSKDTRRSARVIPVDKNERELFESDSKVSRKIIKHKGSKFAYARLWWLSGLAMRQVFESTLNMADTAEGIIIDLRGGWAGRLGPQLTWATTVPPPSSGRSHLPPFSYKNSAPRCPLGHLPEKLLLFPRQRPVLLQLSQLALCRIATAKRVYVRHVLLESQHRRMRRDDFSLAETSLPYLTFIRKFKRQLSFRRGGVFSVDRRDETGIDHTDNDHRFEQASHCTVLLCISDWRRARTWELASVSAYSSAI